MKLGINRIVAAVRGIALAAAATALIAGPNVATAQTPWGRDYFPNVTLTNQDGKKVKFFDDVLDGKIVAINFIFTKCGDVCPLDTAQLKKVQNLVGDRMGKDIFMYSISVDPANDTPAAMKEFMNKYQIKKGWSFLTAPLADVQLIQQKLGIEQTSTNPASHTTTVMVGNTATGQWIKRSPYENPQMLANLLTIHLDPKSRGGGSAQSKDYSAAVAATNVTEGAMLFRTRCAVCHTIGAGDDLGPDLLLVNTRRSQDWLVRWIMEPDKMLAEGDPIAKAQLAQFRNLAMPNLKLDADDAATLISFIADETQDEMEKRMVAEHKGHDTGAAQHDHAKMTMDHASMDHGHSH